MIPSARKFTAVPPTIWSARRWIAKKAYTSASRPPASIAEQEADDPAPALVGAVDAPERAHQHHPLETDVHDAASLGEHAADAREDERRREDEHRRDQSGVEDRLGSGARPGCEDTEPDADHTGDDRSEAEPARPGVTVQMPSATATMPTRIGQTSVRVSIGGSARKRRRPEHEPCGARHAGIAQAAAQGLSTAPVPVVTPVPPPRLPASFRREFQMERIRTSAPTNSTISPWIM